MELKFRNLIELQTYFKDEETCWNYLENLRWNDKVVCPFCNNEGHYHFKNSHTYKCKSCKKKFNAKVGTIFENSKIPLSKWFVAIYIATSHKKGISSLQLSRDIGVTQKTAWFILHRIREMLQVKAPKMLNSMVEIDETYVGGKSTNRHKHKRKNQRGYTNKTMVFALLERNGQVITKVVPKNDGNTLTPIIRENVDRSNTLVTDGFQAYKYLKEEYSHIIVNHLEDEWTNGIYHTNTVEGFFAILKRGIYGIYHFVSPKHLQKYCNEFSFRYNTRKIKEAERFNYSLSVCDRRLKYKDLINN